MENPLNLMTKKALGVVGRLVRHWTLTTGDGLPEGYTANGRFLVFSSEAFRARLVAEGLKDGTPEPGARPDKTADFWLRPDVKSVELVTRTPGCLSILLPEPGMMAEQAGLSPDDIVKIPAIYADTGPEGNLAGASPKVPAEDDDGPAHYDVRMGEDPLRTFLDPYLAAYLCLQCK